MESMWSENVTKHYADLVFICAPVPRLSFSAIGKNHEFNRRARAFYMETFCSVAPHRIILSPIQHKTNATRPERTRRKAIKSEWWAIDISGRRNPASGDFAWLYINRVINWSITHSKGDSCHIKWRDVEHRPSYVSLLRGRFPWGGV